MADTKPTASSSDDLVEALYDIRANLDGVTSGYQRTVQDATYAARSILADIDELLERLRQPVAGDVVERVIDRNELAILLTRYGEFGTNQESNLNTALKAADAILKLIGGGK